MAMMAVEAEDGGGGRQQRRATTTVKSDNDNSNGGQQQWERRITTATDNDGTQDWVADYKGETGEWAVNNNGIRARAPGRGRDKIKKLSLCKNTFFSNMVYPVGFFAPTKTLNLWFWIYQSYLHQVVFQPTSPNLGKHLWWQRCECEAICPSTI